MNWLVIDGYGEMHSFETKRDALIAMSEFIEQCINEQDISIDRICIAQVVYKVACQCKF